MKKTVLTSFILILSMTLLAQGSGLSFTQTSGTYTPITGGTVLISGVFDDDNFAVTLPTAFTFKGVSYTQVTANTNGWISLGSTAPANNTYSPLSSTATVPGFIAPFGKDLENANSGAPEFRWEQSGSEIIFQWKDIKRYTGTINSEIFNFQLRLNTSTGAMQFVYGDALNLTTSTSSPQVGIRAESNAYPANIYNRLVNTVLPTDTWATSADGTSNASTCRFTSASPAASPASGQTYTWTPGDCNTFTCTTNISPANGSTINTASVNLSWNAVAGVNSYRVYIGTSLPLTLAGTFNGTTAAINNLIANTTYTWYVAPASFNCALSGCESSATTFNTVCAVTNCTSNISPLNGATVNTPSVNLSWNAVAGAASYNLYLGTSLPLTLQGNYTGTSATINNLIVNSTYSWYVAPAVSNCSVSGCESSITTFNTVCQVSTCTNNVTPANGVTINNTSVNLSWAAAAGASTYKLYFGTSLPLPLQGTYAGTSATISNLLANTNYSWYVAPAVSNCSVSGCESSATSFNSGCLATNCVTNIAPANAATVTTSGVTLSWNSSVGATSYDLYLGTTNPPTTFIGNIVGTSKSLALVNNTYYWYVHPKPSCLPATNCDVNTTQFTVNNSSGVVNDICAGALDLANEISLGSTSFTGNFEVNNYPSPCTSGGSRDIWFKFIATATTASVSVYGSGTPCTLDPGISILSGVCNSLTCLSGNDAGSCTTVNSVSPSGLTVGNTYYVRISTVSSSGTGAITLSGSNIGSTIVLPLNLISFSGSKQNNNALLQWTTANERNVRQFELQRSDNGQTFTTIGTIVPGNTSYSFTDPNVFSIKDLVFYRLKSIDLDGRFSYSNIIKLNAQSGSILTVSPNPVSNVVSINGLKQKGQLLLYNAEGKLLQQQMVRTQSTTMNMSKYAKGVYVLQYQQSGEIIIQKIIKQ